MYVFVFTGRVYLMIYYMILHDIVQLFFFSFFYNYFNIILPKVPEGT